LAWIVADVILSSSKEYCTRAKNLRFAQTDEVGLVHPICRGIEGKQQNVTFTETGRSQTGNEICTFAEENGPKQGSHEGDGDARAEERESVSHKRLGELLAIRGSKFAAVASQAF
jgi:hypothetical protein